MGMNVTELNVNPCKCCTPLGAVTALYGIKKCMSILHGSQGCSTYIRRHMATHYNEPIDIASSSMTEQGTVFGGEQNLIKGLENLIQQYHPEVIGVATTCLAETIGEDISGIIDHFYQSHEMCRNVKIIPISSPSYAGTQFEGFFRALYGIVTHVEMDTAPNGKINIITGPITPADTRWLKTLLDAMKIQYILLPDVSENLDGGHGIQYDRLPQGGTSVDDIAHMGGARYTIELGTFVGEEWSPAVYLQQQFGIPYSRLDVPCGLQAVDSLLNKLRELGGTIPTSIQKERERFLDAMIDSHKYSALGRATIFGEPDFVKGVVNLCCENGIIPTAVITGSVCKGFEEQLRPLAEKAAGVQFVENIQIKSDMDFAGLEECMVKTHANIMIGNSDGRRVSRKLTVPLIRFGFPIHDIVGGQRLRMLGYEGSLVLLDRIVNTLLLQRNKSFRQDMYDAYYLPLVQNEPAVESAAAGKGMKVAVSYAEKDIKKRTQEHPCFTCGSGKQKYARMHLPVAPKCNIQCNYCLRNYDCPNESRPGVTTEILTPEECLNKFKQVKKMMPNLTVVGIAGPGDALANFEEVSKAVMLIRQEDPTITFCLSTNGLMLPVYAQRLIDLGVTHVTLTINAVDPKIGAQIYDHVTYMGVTYTGESAAGILLGNQLSGLTYLAEHHIVCKVNIVMLKGINEHHIETVVKKVKELGAQITNIMQLIPVKGSAFEQLPLVSNFEIMEMRKTCGVYLEQMMHCRQCRADAIGTLDNDVSILYRKEVLAAQQKASEAGEVQKHKNTCLKKRLAVATKNGMWIDQHFGQAKEFYIYESDGTEIRFVERRNVNKYCYGKENCGEKTDRMTRIIDTIHDCDAVLSLRIGNAPLTELQSKGIMAIATYDDIEHAVKKAAAGL